MKAASLEELRHFLSSPSSGEVCTLTAGIYDICIPVEINRPAIRIAGESPGGRKQTILRRGRTPRGGLYSGPLIRGINISEIEIADLIIEGMRFENGSSGVVDHRHPLSAEPDSPLFTCARPGQSSEVFGESHFATPFEADLFFSNSHRIALHNLELNNPIKFGIALGEAVREVEMERLHISRGGDGGVWCGFSSLAGRPLLPLSKELKERQPQGVHLHNCRIEECGAAGLYLEAAEVAISSCIFSGNHRDFPYNCDGGQIEIDYKADSITIDSCSILDGPSLCRKTVPTPPLVQPEDQRTTLFRTVGIEACGRRLFFKNNHLEGNSHEGIHFNGARHVRICGSNTRIKDNHKAAHGNNTLACEPRQNISITTSAEYWNLNARAENFRIEEILCENGIIFWSDGSVPELRLDHVAIQNCDLRGKEGRGIVICDNQAQRSLQGVNWDVSGNRT
jgi:hypothetical protein